MPIHAKITAYKDIIVCELVTFKSIPGELVTSLDTPGNIGQVIHDTKNNLGVSEEAIVLLKRLGKRGGSFSDIMWFPSNDGVDNFGWIGGPYAIFDPSGDVAFDRDSGVKSSYVSIPNDVPEGAKNAIDSGDEGDDE